MPTPPAQRLELKHEEGGYRHYLNGEPVHAGNQLRLWLPAVQSPGHPGYRPGGWVWARYESRPGGRATLYLAGDRVLDLASHHNLRWPEFWEK